MDAKDLLKAGRLKEARERITEEVKASPADAAKRTLLFQVLSFCGEWDKAERHLDILAAGNPQAETGVQVYRNLISAERKRLEVTEGKNRPSFMTKLPSWLEMQFLAREKLENGDFEEASSLFREIASQTLPVRGSLDGAGFKGFKDMDDFLEHVLEVFIHDSYLWFPFSSLRELAVPEPKSQLDLLWAPARITTVEGLDLSCFLPVLYPGSFRSEDDRIRLGRVTDWQDRGGGCYQGMGQHLFLVGDREKALLELRDISFKAPKKGEA
jgi:type VI secretion system protein ImpE